jgi:hypothetical protein
MSMTGYDYNYDLAIREVGSQVVVTNNLGRTALYGELVYLGGYLGFVMDFAGIANAAAGRIALLDETIEFSTAQIEATDTFTAGKQAYFVPGGASAAGKIVDAPESGSIPIGYITAEQGTGGAQTAVTVRAFDSRSGQCAKIAKVVIDSATDYSTTGKAVQIPVGAMIVDVWAVATATHTSGTAQVLNGASAVHTALVMAADQVLTRMAAAVDDTKLLVTTDAITVKTNSSGDAGIVFIEYI